MMYRKIVFLLSVFFICSGFLNIFSSGWKKHVPIEFKDTKITYKVDGTHFFGPSGINEAFIVYSLSDNVVNKIKKEGLTYLEGMDSTKRYQHLTKKYHEDTANLNPLSKEERSVRFKYLDDIKGNYSNWQETPANKEDKNWMRKSYGDYQDISLESFYGDSKFLSKGLIKRLERGMGKDQSHLTVEDFNFVHKIKLDYIKLIEEIISSEGSYYGYGKHGVLLISPEHNKMFLLYRD